MSTAKSYNISKLTVWEAYQRVKANRGAAGIDEQSIAQFEQKLQRNLYKVWNRMASGSYFPPPVRQVEIPKQSGGKRKLGIPTVADRVAQTVVKLLIERVWTVFSMGIPTGTDPESQPSRRWRSLAGAVGV